VLKIGLGQFNSTVGDLAGNVEKIKTAYAQAMAAGVDLLVLGEMALCGYPPEDLLHKEHFLQETKNALLSIAKSCPEKTILLGFAEKSGGECYNSMAVLQNGKLSQVHRKFQLPNYGVFDEKRYFAAGTKPIVFEINDISIVPTICEDIWEPDELKKFIASIDKKHLILNISASPFHVGKTSERQMIVSQCAKKLGCAVGYCNLIGGQDELVFDGRSMFADADGKVVAIAKAFAEDLLIAEIEVDNGKIKIAVEKEPEENVGDIGDVYQALVLGTRDYVRKNGFEKAVIGLSGGIDSSLTVAIAVEALGAKNVTGVTMPSKFNSPETIEDAKKTADNLGIDFLEIAIEKVLGEFNDTLGLAKGWTDTGIAYENLQARIRGSILMSLSNKFGWMVLTTGNKSETAVGYSTLYGDSAGGFAVIKDVPKTMVYKLCEYINEISDTEIVPVDVIRREPSAELAPNQKDSDSLGDYDTLDKILKGYVEEDKSAQQLVDSGLDRERVNKIIRLVDRNEYKRRQSPPGVKITPKAFGRDRRIPITNRYVDQAE